MKKLTLIYISIFSFHLLSFSEIPRCETSDSIEIVTITFLRRRPVDSSLYFSVGENRYVLFAPGNLEYNAPIDSFRFAQKDYLPIGDNNKNAGPLYNGWIDLFGWGCSGYLGQAPWMFTQEESGYGPPIHSGQWSDDTMAWDMGWNNPIYDPNNGVTYSSHTWRILSDQEWQYVMSERGENKSGVVKLVFANKYAICLLPDKFIKTADVSSSIQNLGFNNIVNIRTEENYNRLKSSGAVFLPLGYSRSGRYVIPHNEENNGYYMTSSAPSLKTSKSLLFKVNAANGSWILQDVPRSMGICVRPVSDIY